MKYFLHDTNARNDEKVTLLFIKFGYEGIGLFYSILEILASQEKPVSELVLKSQLNIKKKLEKQLSFIYEIELLSLINGDVFNENLLNYSEKYQVKKEKTREKVAEWRKKQADKKNVTSYVPISNPPKVKKSKVKKSKDNKGVVFPFTSNEFLKIWESWKAYKFKEHKFRYKSEESEQAALMKLNNLANGNEKDAIEIVKESIAQSWKGFFELKNKSNGKQNSGFKEYLARVERGDA